MKNIVLIGGGTGTSTLLSGLNRYPLNISAIVSTADDGGSTGRLRAELGVMPSGDIRQCLKSLSRADKKLLQLFSYRFEKGSLKGHAIGNLILAALERHLGGIEPAIAVCQKFLDVKGAVIPVTLKPIHLSATLINGKKIMGEHNIDEPMHNGYLKIKSLKISPELSANPQALAVIKKADAIVFGPGDLYTSILPNLLVRGVVGAIASSTAKKILITNIMTKHGQTDGFCASHFVRVMNEYLTARHPGSKIDVAIVNSRKPDQVWVNRYKKEKAKIVESDVEEIKKLGAKAITAPLVSSNTFRKHSSDVLRRSYLRHDARKIAGILWEIL